MKAIFSILPRQTSPGIMWGPDRFSRFDVYRLQTNKYTAVQTDKQSKYTNWFVWKINTYCGKWNCRITKIISIKLQFSSPFLFAIGTGELGTSERNTFNHDWLIRISNVDTFNFLLNPHFLDIIHKNQKPVLEN